MRYGQLVIGPAGSGKSTYCSIMQKHAAADRRTIDVVNLDPAAEHFDYDCLIDIRELISVDDVAETLNLGPNGSLVYSFEYLIKNLSWLKDELKDTDDDYIIFDCPGQLELYTHMTVMKDLITALQDSNFHLCVVFLVDSQFLVDASKFLSGTMAALTAMINLELPHVNVLSKMDLLSKAARKQLDMYLEPDPMNLLAEEDDDHYSKLTQALGRVIEDYSLVRFLPLNIKDEESIADIKLTVDNIIQYGEEEDVRMRDFDEPDPEDDD
ncbi:GPN-loop GTPase 3 [Copidosoma floridanum]|uniref:GPN-loop GTPase 3 n=1 Tax=Copidosoma floridanum TaxID=29053 RepID=UPI0006C944A4|nr:GPN-loop GTPase 3 [Copidosoma floridanum]